MQGNFLVGELVTISTGKDGAASDLVFDCIHTTPRVCIASGRRSLKFYAHAWVLGHLRFKRFLQVTVSVGHKLESTSLQGVIVKFIPSMWHFSKMRYVHTGWTPPHIHKVLVQDWVSRIPNLIT